MLAKKKRTTINASIKREVILYKQNHPQATHETIATHFNLKNGIQMSRRAIGDILAKSERWLCTQGSNGSAKKGAHPLLEHSLFTWFSHVRSQNMVITEDLLKEKAASLSQAMNIENFKCSNGWVHRFKTRFSISSKIVSGESGSVDKGLLSKGIEDVQEVIKCYSPENIFNVDETALFYEMLPNKTLSNTKNNHGLKQSKKRITIIFGVNADGTEKLKPLVIGHSKNPRCFKNFNKDLFVEYQSTKKGWMNSKIWIDWLIKLDQKMKNEGRKIILLADNAPCHFSNDDLTNVKLHFLPPNTTSHIQPLDAGIFNSFKTHYKSFL